MNKIRVHRLRSIVALTVVLSMLVAAVPAGAAQPQAVLSGDAVGQSFNGNSNGIADCILRVDGAVQVDFGNSKRPGYTVQAGITYGGVTYWGPAQDARSGELVEVAQSVVTQGIGESAHWSVKAFDRSGAEIGYFGDTFEVTAPKCQ